MRHAILIVMLLVMTPFICSTLHAQQLITSCSSIFTDQGGDSSQYLNDENSSWLICPDTTSEYLTLEFIFVDIEVTTDTAVYSTGCKDRLFIYDGLDDQATLVGSYCGEESGSGMQPFDRAHTLRVGDQFRPTSASGCFYIKFESDADVTKSGWIADVTCCVPSLTQGVTDGIDVPLPDNDGRLFSLSVDNSCIRKGSLQDFTEWTPNGQSCFASGLQSAHRSFYAFQSNSSGGFIELSIEALDSVGNMEMLVFGPVTLDSAMYTGGVTNDCVMGAEPWPLFFNAGPNQTYILAIGSDLKGNIQIDALPSSIGLNGVLPVEITSYAISNLKHAVTLDWSTTHEINNDGFSIHRSSDGHSYESIGWVDAKDRNSNVYQYQDLPEVKGDLYYYITQRDLDGQEKRYDILHTHIEYDAEIILYPNPTSGRLQLTSSRKISTGSIMAVSVYDTMGSLALSTTIQPTQEIDLTALNDGVYLIEIISDGSRTLHRQVLSR